jgi:hypothetical protein
LERLAGVKQAVVDRTKKEVRVAVEGNGPSAAQVVAAIQAVGRFQATPAA